MPFVALLSRDRELKQALETPLGAQSVAMARTWDRLTWLIIERPVTAVVVDSEALAKKAPADRAVGELRRRFPSVAIVFLARSHADPHSLLRLGRAGVGGLALLPVDVLSDAALGLRRSLGSGTVASVTRAVSPFVPQRETRALRLALEGVQLGWNSEDLALHVGFTRQHLSVGLKACGLPSTGHLLVWAKLLHAGSWLSDPGRSAESVSRQLGYSTGSAFRTALRNYVGMTPSEVKMFGGLRPVLLGLLDACGLPHRLESSESIA